jgi:predicted anti-sigma-YlaC factor YlaD
MNPMTCRELVELVTDYLDGVLNSDAQQRFQDHLAMCDGCERYLDQFRVTIGALGEVPTSAVPVLPNPDLPDDMRAKLLIAFRDWPL